MHGTGTGLGDPIECGAAAATYGKRPVNSTPLSLTTSKTSLGHSEPAAGVVGMLHALHAARQRATQPLLHLRSMGPFVAGALATGGGTYHAPRHPGARAQSRGAAEGLLCGVSAFAFQVMAESAGWVHDWGFGLMDKKLWQNSAHDVLVHLLIAAAANFGS